MLANAILMAAVLISPTTIEKTTTELVAKYGESQRPRIQRGITQVAQFWRAEDGDEAQFADFVRTSFAGDATTLDALFNRMQFALESLDGHMNEIARDWRWQSD